MTLPRVVVVQDRAVRSTCELRRRHIGEPRRCQGLEDGASARVPPQPSSKVPTPLGLTLVGQAIDVRPANRCSHEHLDPFRVHSAPHLQVQIARRVVVLGIQ